MTIKNTIDLEHVVVDSPDATERIAALEESVASLQRLLCLASILLEQCADKYARSVGVMLAAGLSPAPCR